MVHDENENHTLQNRGDVLGANQPTGFQDTFQFHHRLKGALKDAIDCRWSTPEMIYMTHMINLVRLYDVL